jgi:hypothetical protein
MATLNKYTFGAEAAIVPVTLTASDDAIVDLSKKTTLVVFNGTAGSLDINVVGDTATSATCSGIGSIDLTGGKTFTVGIGATFQFPLNTKYKEWLGDGNLTITGGTGAEAYILEV